MILTIWSTPSVYTIYNVTESTKCTGWFSPTNGRSWYSPLQTQEKHCVEVVDNIYNINYVPKIHTAQITAMVWWVMIMESSSCSIISNTQNFWTDVKFTAIGFYQYGNTYVEQSSSHIDFYHWEATKQVWNKFTKP